MRKWIQLCTSVLLAFLCMSALYWLSTQATFARQLREGVEQNDHDHGSLFYTESAAADRAVQQLQQRLRSDE